MRSNCPIRVLVSILLLTIFPLYVFAQTSAGTVRKTAQATWENPEFGDISEIVNMTKVYVFSSDFEARKIILEELKKDETIIVVDKSEDCEMLINFGAGSITTGWTSTIGGSGSYNNDRIGDFMVVIRGKIDDQGRQRQRIVWTTRKNQSFAAGITFSRHPAKNATREFLKRLKEARQTKK